MNKQDFAEWLFTIATEEFENHLEIPNNNRIVFSGKFGHGKTTFIKYFFNEKYYDNYQPIFLYPVNYSVSSNEDIFEYIKYDILIELLESEQYTFEHIDISKWQSLSFFLANGPEKILQTIVGMIGKTGTPEGAVTETFANSMINLSNKLAEAHKQNQENLSEAIKIKNLFSKIENTEGSIYESNAITNIIKSALATYTAKEKVLIIDDLDRIDPEHIFRILNVFAAHLDSNDGRPNKFGFDKVILVCDIDNIRNIFKAKFGMNTDFNGYIDKYYSHKVFQYDIKKDMLRFSVKVLSASKVIDGDSYADDRSGEYYKSLVFNSFFEDVLKLLVDYGEIDMRNLIKWRDMHIRYHYYSYIGDNRLSKEMHHFLLGITMLIDIKGGYSALKKAIESVRLVAPLRSDFRSHCNNLAYIYLYTEHKGRYGTATNPNSVHFTINGKIAVFELHDGAVKSHVIGGSKQLMVEDFTCLFGYIIDMIESRQIQFTL